MNTFFVILLTLAALPVGAQQMYRCGNTFSQSPCGPDQKVIGPPPAASEPVAPDLPASPETVAAATAACRDRLGRDVQFRDPESVRVAVIERRGIYKATIAGMRVDTRLYLMRVNAKNGYGGYTGDKDYLCLADWKDERLVILVRRASGD